MENNEIMNNDEVIEATEEIVKVSSGNGLRKVAGVGLAMLAGGLACKFIVEPAWARFKAWKMERHMMESGVDGCVVDVDVTLEDSEEE